jgi:D-alanine-D-alanine ligase
MNLNVALTYNLKRQVSSEGRLPQDFFAEFDDEDTVNAITNALEKGGCDVEKIEADEKVYSKLMKQKPQIVFNIAEGLRGESRESQLPALLEMLGIPYTGSGPLTLSISLDKGMTHRVLRSSKIPSPSFQVLSNAKTSLSKQLDFPLIVKPIGEGSSKGIWNDSLVRDEKDLRRKVAQIIETYRQSAIVEEFLPGREFTVGLIGNDEPEVLPIVEILLDKLPAGANPLYGYEAKWMWDTTERPVQMFSCPARVSSKIEDEIKRISVKAFEVLGCRDICRIDFRLDNRGKPHVLEVNPLPGLIPDPDAHSCLPEAASVAGYTYDQLICTILWYGLKRHGLEDLLENTSLVKIL